MTKTAPSRALIDLEAYAHNLREVRNLVGKGVGIVATVKGDAYGHGMLPVARRALEEGVAMLGVATVDEGVALREAGITTPILVYVQPARDALPAVVAHRLTIMVCDVETAEALGQAALRANRVVPVHCKVDTGMGRQGFDLRNAEEAIGFITRISHIDIEGVATHFATAEIPDDSYTLGQIKSFKQLLKHLERNGIPHEAVHAANSAGIVNYPASHFDMVRPGLMTYGVNPTTKRNSKLNLRPVLTWRTRVAQVRSFAAGDSIGYGRTFVASEPMRGAVLPVGYADGYRVAFSNRAEVLINGRRCAVRGRVSMDQCMVDISHAGPVQPGTVATLIGADGEDRISAEELARRADTIPYEILTAIGARVAREYV